MYKTKEYECYSIPELLNEYTENQIQTIINNFVSFKNSEIQDFLIKNSIDFTKKHQAITYLIFDLNSNLMGYFTLAIKPIEISANLLSGNALKKILRISEIDKEDNTVNPSAYLIAQLGKNESAKINIDDIFEMINYYINGFQNGCGGVVEFLESENSQKLIDMYKDRGFKAFSIRKSKSVEDRKLIQMYRLI